MKIANIQHLVLRIFFILFFWALSLGQLQRLQLTPMVAIYLHEILLVITTLVLANKLFPQYTLLLRRIQKYRFLKLLILFLCVQTFLLQLIKLELISMFYLLRIVLYAQLFFLTTIAIKQNIFTKKYLYRLIIIMSALIGVFGLIQYLIFPDTRWLFVMGWDDHYYRLISTLFDPGFTGLVISFGLILYLILFAKEISLLRNILFAGFFMITILLTYSRASYLALAITLVFLLIKTNNKKLLAIIICFFALIPILPRPAGEGVKLERTGSVVSRISSNQRAIMSLSLTEVIWGRGLYKEVLPSATTLPNHAITPDNSFIFIFISTGAIGLFLLLGVLWELRWLLLREPLFPLLILIGMHSMINNSLFYVWTLTILFILFGLASLKGKIEDKQYKLN